MARAQWSGSLSFGLVSVPVQLIGATRDLDYHFHQLHEKDKARIEQRRFCSDEDEEVGWEEIGHGYELKRKQVVLTDDELASVEPRKTRTIDVEAFVPRAEVDPIYFDHPYLLVPVGDSEGTRRAYKLLVDAMEGLDRLALGRFVMGSREYLTAIEVRDGMLALSTMRFAEEVRPSGSIPSAGKKPTPKQLKNAVAVIEELTTDWDPASYEDCYRERLRKVIDRKRKGSKIETPDAVRQPKPAPDLMAALEETLAEVKKSGNLRAAAQVDD